ncbi:MULTISPECIES: hypothetical protein [Lactococcus]|uniref:Uncharacterized protein n=1 Tax=Lactococcus lactis subsp. cremoris TaxID=1359 RepID=A0A1V0PDQ1_LACLC|nr:hypothetical protein [Lactococcus cremoris]ARE27228.1 hypothetical protein LLJM1_04425 [Lactococcus cremoris]KZK43688.1 PE-PGRS family protein [Lactococcus cremoris]
MKNKTKIGTAVAVVIFAGAVGGFVYSAHAKTVENNSEQNATIALSHAQKKLTQANLNSAQDAIKDVKNKSVKVKDNKKYIALKTEFGNENTAKKALAKAEQTDSAQNIKVAQEAIDKVTRNEAHQTLMVKFNTVNARYTLEQKATASVKAFTTDYNNSAKLKTAQADVAKLSATDSKALKAQLSKEISDAQNKAKADAAKKAASAAKAINKGNEQNSSGTNSGTANASASASASESNGASANTAGGYSAGGDSAASSANSGTSSYTGGSNYGGGSVYSGGSTSYSGGGSTNSGTTSNGGASSSNYGSSSSHASSNTPAAQHSGNSSSSDDGGYTPPTNDGKKEYIFSIYKNGQCLESQSFSDYNSGYSWACGEVGKYGAGTTIQNNMF